MSLGRGYGSVAVMETAKGRQSMNSSPSGTSNNFNSLKKIRKTQFEKDMNALEKDRLCQLLKKDARANSRQFWEAMKAAAVQRYESTDGAFLAFASSSDCMMSLEQFQELCEELGFTLSLSTARSLFDQKLRDWDMRALSLQDFQDACIVAQLDRTRGRMRSHKQNLLACAGHIDSFIKNLALYTGEDARRRAVNRFQQKLTPRFCESLWISLQQWAQRRAQLAEATISCDIFLKMVDAIQSFQAYEVEFLSHIYERVDRTRKGEVFLPDLAVAVMLLATNGSRCDKARLIFTVFDTDSDGCLSSEQLLKMYCSLVIHAAIARGDQPSYDADLLLGDELSLAKARRFYEYTAAHPSDALDDDLCTFEEWWSILEGNFAMMEELLPGTYGITWVLRPRGRCERPESKKPSKHGRRPEWNLLRTAAILAGDGSGDRRGDESDQNSRKASKMVEKVPSKRRTVAPEKSGLRPPSARRLPEDSAEKFRIHAAIRFRHAVRGEWDAVAALQSGPPGSADHQSLALPALAEERAQRSALWADEVGSFSKRQRRGNWNDNHRDTITNWSQLVPRDEDKAKKSERGLQRTPQTRSLPELRRNSRSSLGADSMYNSAQMSFDDIRAATAAMISDTTKEGRSSMDRLKVGQHRQGPLAMHRFRSAATVKTIPESEDHGNTAAVEWCELCHCRHPTSAHC
ncbi:unnamed protein product [Symbiodinium sp. CCMP2592]|nr:unnamed protein product [Symbiodinium sp. CCMP2592]